MSNLPPKDLFFKIVDPTTIQAIKIEVPFWKKFFGSDLFKRFMIIIGIAVLWELIADYIQTNIPNGELLFPKFTLVLSAWLRLLNFMESWDFYLKFYLTLEVLVLCSLLGIVLAFLFSLVSLSSSWGRNFLMLIAVPLSSLPSVALISVAALGFKSNYNATVFVVTNSVFWTVLTATYAGFSHVPKTFKMVGQNYGLGVPKLVTYVLLPAALPSILTGIRLGVSRAFQSFVAVEMVQGVVKGKGALGFFIAESKNNFEPPMVYSGLFTILVIAWLIDNKFFGWLEEKTIVRWGMKNE